MIGCGLTEFDEISYSLGITGQYGARVHYKVVEGN